MKELKTIIKKELKKGENVFITTRQRLNSQSNNWWLFDEYKPNEVFNKYTGKEKVIRYWHEEGLCIIIEGGTEQYLASQAAVGHPTEPYVLGAVVAVGQGIEGILAKRLDGLVELLFRTGEHDRVIEMVHRQLGDTALQGQTLCLWHGVGHLLQVADDREMVFQLLPDTCRVALMDG